MYNFSTTIFFLGNMRYNTMSSSYQNLSDNKTAIPSNIPEKAKPAAPLISTTVPAASAFAMPPATPASSASSAASASAEFLM